MKTLFGTTALVVAMALPAFAQDTAAPMPTDDAATMTSPYLAGVDRGVRASDFIGKRVYVTEQDTTAMVADGLADADANWEDAGEISDLIISLNGDTEAVLVDFGGFLGIGEKTVAISMANLVMVPDADSADDYFIVFQGNKAAIEGAPEFDPDMIFEAAPADAAMAPGADTAANTTAAAPATDMNATTETANDMAAAEPADLAVMAETDLVGKRVMGMNDEDVGEISAVAMDADGKISGAVVDVGGFLGMGEKRVALGSEALTIVRDANGEVQHFRVTMTQEQLETLPVYEG